MAEIIVVHGPPGSGKSEHSRKLAETALQGRSVEHLSAGDRMRAIRNGEVVSQYSDLVSPPSGQRVRLDNAIVTGVIFEGISHRAQQSVVLIDGYPRFADAVPHFMDAVNANNHTYRGCLALEVPERVSIERVMGRGTRKGELNVSEAFVRQRYEEYERFTLPAINALANEAPVIIINAVPPIPQVWTTFTDAVVALINRGC